MKRLLSSHRSPIKSSDLLGLTISFSISYFSINMLTSSSTILLFTVLFCILLSANAQFFFPFAMGQNNVAPNYNYGGTTYGNGYGVKDSEGFFSRCSGWTCQN